MSLAAEKVRKGEQLWRRASDLEDEGDVAGAIRLYRAAAKLGNASAQSNLGNLLDDQIKPARSKEAVYWYKRAIRLGNYLGARNLAVHYKNLGQKRWQSHWLTVAARMGDPEAPKELRKLEASRGQR